MEIDFGSTAAIVGGAFAWSLFAYFKGRAEIESLAVRVVAGLDDFRDEALAAIGDSRDPDVPPPDPSLAVTRTWDDVKLHPTSAAFAIRQLAQKWEGGEPLLVWSLILWAGVIGATLLGAKFAWLPAVGGLALLCGIFVQAGFLKTKDALDQDVRGARQLADSANDEHVKAQQGSIDHERQWGRRFIEEHREPFLDEARLTLLDRARQLFAMDAKADYFSCLPGAEGKAKSVNPSHYYFNLFVVAEQSLCILEGVKTTLTTTTSSTGAPVLTTPPAGGLLDKVAGLASSAKARLGPASLEPSVQYPVVTFDFRQTSIDRASDPETPLAMEAECRTRELFLEHISSIEFQAQEVPNSDLSEFGLLEIRLAGGECVRYPNAVGASAAELQSALRSVIRSHRKKSGFAPPKVVATPPTQGMKTCPMCAEDVKSAARLCRYCGHKFDEVAPVDG